MELDFINNLIGIAGQELKTDLNPQRRTQALHRMVPCPPRDSHFLKLTDLYAVAGVSKQAMHKHRKAVQGRSEQEKKVVAAMEKMHKDHNRMSSRKVYAFQREPASLPLGRDEFEQLAFANGYRV